MFGHLKRINAPERCRWKKKAKGLQFCRDIIELSVPRLTQLITVNRLTAWQLAFYFRRYDERNHASLTIPSRKVATQVQVLGSTWEKNSEEGGRKSSRKERVRGRGSTEVFRRIDRGFEFITDASSKITPTRVIKNILCAPRIAELWRAV